MDEVHALWDECSEVDIGTVQPLQNEECLRQKCVSNDAVYVLVYHFCIYNAKG